MAGSFGDLNANIETAEQRKKRIDAEAARQGGGNASTPAPRIGTMAPPRGVTAISPTGQASTVNTRLSDNTYGQPFAPKAPSYEPKPIVSATDPTPRQPMQLTEAEIKAGASVGSGTGAPGTASYVNPQGNTVNLSGSQVGNQPSIAAASRMANQSLRGFTPPPLFAGSASANTQPQIVQPVPPSAPAMPSRDNPIFYPAGRTTAQSINANASGIPGMRPVAEPGTPPLPPALPSGVSPTDAAAQNDAMRAPVGSAAGRAFGIVEPVPPAAKVWSFGGPSNPDQIARMREQRATAQRQREAVKSALTIPGITGPSYQPPKSSAPTAPDPAQISQLRNQIAIYERDGLTNSPGYKAAKAKLDSMTTRRPLSVPAFTPVPAGVGAGRV